MVIARGTIEERPFGLTLGTLAKRQFTGQVTIAVDEGTLALAFDRGYLVAATSPHAGDGAASIALDQELITLAEAAAIDRRLSSHPDGDEIEACAYLGRLSADDLHRLRRKAIAQRAGRALTLVRGELVLTAEVYIPVVARCEMHVGGVIFKGAMKFMATSRLSAIVRQLGHRFELVPERTRELPYYGFGAREQAAIQQLAGGLTVDAIDAIDDEEQRRLVLAAIYALVSCGGAIPHASTPRLARGTRDPVSASRPSAQILVPPSRPSAPMPAVRPSAPDVASMSREEDAFQRGLASLRANRLDEALEKLELAARLAPENDVYQATLAWARFCAAPDKGAVAVETRRALARATTRSRDAVQPHYYYGMVERMLNRPDEALKHFRDALDLAPNHVEAATEVRFLMRRR